MVGEKKRIPGGTCEKKKVGEREKSQNL